MTIKEDFLTFAKMIGGLVTILTAVGFFAEPYFEDFIEDLIIEHEQKTSVEDSSKQKLRDLFAEKMGVAPDEVHIEIGRMYQKEDEHIKEVYKYIDADFEHNKKHRNKIIREIKNMNPATTLKIE